MSHKLDEERIKSIQFKFIIVIAVVLIFIVLLFSLALLNLLPTKAQIKEFFSPRVTLDQNKDFIKFLNSDDGDAILLCSNGVTTLIDTGPVKKDDYVVGKIWDLGIKRLDAIYITNTLDCHIGSLPKLVSNFDVANIIIPDGIKDKDLSYNFLSAKNDILRNGGNLYIAKQGLVGTCGDFEITVLGQYTDLKEQGDRSVILMVSYNDTKLLLMSDGGFKTEDKLISDGINLDADILKISKHGSNNATSIKLLQSVTPNDAVISCAAESKHFFTDSDVFKNIKKLVPNVYRTNLCGEITLHFYENNRYEVSLERFNVDK